MPPRPAIRHTVEFDRINTLPRRTVDPVDADGWVEALNRECLDPRAPEGTTLMPWQAYSLAEIITVLGAWLALPVGQGKTLISWLMFYLLGSRRPLLIVPAVHVKTGKVWGDFMSYRGVWRSPPTPPEVVSKEWLALEGSAGFLEAYDPDAVCIDEGDRLMNPNAGAARRIDRWRRKNPEPPVVSMSGSPGRKSPLDYHHTLRWCLGETRMPLPRTHGEASTWAQLLEFRKHEGQRPLPGPLGDDRDEALEWYSRRLRETPGIVIVDEDSCDQRLEIEWRIAREDTILDAAFETFLKKDESPTGEVVTDPLSRWRLDGFIGSGLVKKYRKQPPEEWRILRRSSAKIVRDTIDASTHWDRPLDTEKQAFRHLRDHPVIQGWLAIRDTFDATDTVDVWLTDSAVLSVIDWIKELRRPGVVWCGSVDFGKAVARKANLPYYGAEGDNVDGSIYDAPKGKPIVCSWKANLTGFNLQAWPEQLIEMPPQSAKDLEQIFGRGHRRGQDQHVRSTILITSGGTIDAFETAIGEARFNREANSLTQKILRASIRRRSPVITESNRFRWATRTRKTDNE